MRLYIWPTFSGEDLGDGGVRRVVEAQRRSLPRLHDEFVDDPAEADLIASHITIPEEFLRRYPDKPFVAHCHGLYWSEYEWFPWAYKANEGVLKAVCTANATTAPSEWVAQVIRRHTSRPVRVIPHGVSPQEWKPPKDQHRGYVLWNKTRVDPVCTTDDLDVLTANMHDVPFVSTFGSARPNVTLTGRVPYATAKELVQHAGVYLATTRETFGIGTLEALSSGVPVVGYRFGGQTDIITHGEDGWLAEPGDVRGLAEGVRWALEYRDRISPVCRRKALTFGWGRAAKAYHDLYAEVLSRHASLEFRPRTTVVVAAYGLDKYLPDTLKSLQAQVDRDWECIVVDDASPDRCGEIAESYAANDERFRVIHNATNQDMTESRNIAIREARGRYILPLDADDQFTPHTVGTLADALDADPALHAAYGGVLFVDEDGRTPTNYGLSNQPPGHSGWPYPMDPWKQVAGFNLQPYASAFRRTAWEQVGGFRSRLKTAEDADFWTRLASWGFQSRMVTEADTLIYRNREGSLSRTRGEHRMDYLRWFPWAKALDLAPAGLAGPHAVGLLEPRVSVIIPVGPGHERLVLDAVDSVQAQSYSNWEVIVVNDSGNPLHLPAWAKVVCSDRRDPGAARNLGIAQATAPLYLPLDADDYLQPDALQWLLTAYSESGGIVYPDFYEDPDRAGEYRPYRLRDWDCRTLTVNGTLHAITALTPVAVWKQVGGYSEDGLGWEDWDFQFRCAEAGVCSHRLAHPLWTYRKFTGFRRDYDEQEFEARKAQMMGRWGPYFRGETQLMACGCSGKTIAPTLNLDAAAKAAQQQYGDAVLVENIGNKVGKIRYRGVTGATYDFRAGTTLWVAGADVPLFAARSDFRVHTAPPAGDVSAAAAPVLSA